MFFLVLTAYFPAKHSPLPEERDEKPILLVTTDIGGDPDDQQSLTRLLVYSNEFDIRGLIASASGCSGHGRRDKGCSFRGGRRRGQALIFCHGFI
ncbi:MAG: nucleoside hydrolase-like domain-containing protein [Bacteroidota bacterium]